MPIISTRRTLITSMGAGLAALGLPGPGFAAGKKHKIALSNSYIGNEWRIEMENLFKAAIQMEPYKSTVEGSWYNSGNNVSRESQQISGLISQRVDAILVDAASPTRLNGILHQETSRGILVISFDNVVTSPAAIKVNTDQVEFGKTLAEWVAKKIGGKGNVIMVTGVAGTTVNEDRNKGADMVWKQHPGIKVVNRYAGDWASSTAEKNTAAILPSLPKIDGIWCQGGTDGVLKAFIAANRPLPPTAGEAENGFRKFMLPQGYMGHKVEGLSIGQPPYLVLVALELACQILDKKRARGDITIPFPYVTNATVKAGETVFPAMADSFFTDFTDSGPNAVLEICVDAVTKGTPCPGTLSVHLPKA